MSWFLRSMADRDTHYGELRGDGLVVAECGTVSEPISLAFGRLSLRGEPPDPDQACPACRRAEGKHGKLGRRWGGSGAPGGRAAPGRRDATQFQHARFVIHADRLDREAPDRESDV